MEDTTQKPRRLIPTVEKKIQAELKIRPDDVSVESILNDAMQTAAIEIAKYRMKVARGNTLDLKEARIVQGWIETMVKLKKENREADRSDKLDKLSNEELMTLAKRVLNENSSMIEAEQSDEEDD